jgi:hypothetical protein
MQTVEAIIDTMGNVKVLSDIRLPNDRKALITILDEEPTNDAYKKDKLFDAFEKLAEQDIFREIEDPVEWQRKLRDEWE